VYHLVDGFYRLIAPNQHGRYPISILNVELGLWEGCYPSQAQSARWLRWWDFQNNLLLTGQEQAQIERQRAEVERQRAEAERQRADFLAAYLRSQGIDPDELPN
jgi:hypothetical protein